MYDKSHVTSVPRNLLEPTWTQDLKCSWFPLRSWIIYTCYLLITFSLPDKYHFMVISLYGERTSCLRHFSPLLNFWNSRKQWKECHPSRQDKSTPSQQKQQEKAQLEDSWEDSETWKILLQKTEMTLDWDFQHWQARGWSRKAEVIQGKSNFGPRHATFMEETKLDMHLQ